MQQARAAYKPQLPIVLTGGVKIVEGQPTQSAGDQEDIQKLFPNTYGLPEIRFEKAPAAESAEPINVGVILSGGQAPGGHNVISGLFDGIKSINRKSRLYGFLMGPGGLVDHKYKELTADIIDEYRNTGGFDIIGSGRTKLETKEQFDKGLEILRELDIKALVIIGGDDSNTNAAILAEYYKAIGAGVQVIGVPKTIDGDLKNDVIETSFGFDTATKVYSEVVGNIQRDCNSAKKYWHFIKLMGRSASHIALECALQCQPNVCIVSEEVEAKNMTLAQVSMTSPSLLSPVPMMAITMVLYSSLKVSSSLSLLSKRSSQNLTTFLLSRLMNLLPLTLKNSVNGSWPSWVKRMPRHMLPSLPVLPVSLHLTVIPTETCRFRSLKQKSFFLKWSANVSNSLLPKVSIKASMRQCTISSDMKAVVRIRLTLMRTIAMRLAIRLHALSQPARPVICRAFAI